MTPASANAASTALRAPAPHPAPRSHTHGHLWHLADGTPAHAPPGLLTLDADGRLACHLCGRWFDHLGLHLRRHGWDAERYRHEVGLALHAPLCSERVSASIAGRQQRRFAADPAVRARLAPGMAAARSGDLGRAAAAAGSLRRGQGDEPAAVIAVRRDRLAAGRQLRSTRSAQRLDALVADHGAVDLDDFLRREYTAGASIEQLRARTGLGRDRLRARMLAAGIIPRPAGRNDPRSQHRRAAEVERSVAERLGVDDVRGWLASQRASGVAIVRLAESTGRSEAWVRARLRGGVTTRTG